MPSFSEIHSEMEEEPVKTQYDIIRGKYLKKLSEKTGRNTILYYSGWLQKPPVRGIAALMSINDNDKSGFMSTIRGLDTSKGLDIILHTPGGDLAATESLIDYIGQKMNGDVRAIIPQLAMSGGTIIACSCKEILMGKQSSLGPFDPQIQGYSASGIMAEVSRANEDMKRDGGMINVWRPILSGYPPGLIETCINAILWSKELAEKYLAKSMFKEELESNPDGANEKIKRIVNHLTEPGVTRSHSRHIPMPVCKDIGMNIFEIERDQEIQDLVLSVHHAAALTIMNTPITKIIENHDSQSYLTGYRSGKGGG